MKARARLGCEMRVCEIGGWQVRTWDRPASDATSGRDQILVRQTAGKLRLAVVDGVSPTRMARGAAGMDAARYAAAVVRCSLEGGVATEAGLQQANELLHCRGVPARDQMSACVMVCDLQRNGVADAVRAGDCELWCSGDGGWTQAFPEPMLSGAASRRLHEWIRANPDRTIDETHDAERRMLARRDVWRTTPVGRFSELKVTRRQFHVEHAVVLATDGARLNEERLQSLERWLETQRAWEDRHRPGLTLHDDVAVVTLRKR